MATLCLGVAIGAGNLIAAAHHGEATRWTTQLTVAPHVAPEAGLPEENPRVRPDGVIVTGFVERVGDPVPIAGPGGQSYAAEQLTIDAVKSLIRSQLSGIETPPTLVVACPAYWSDAARDQFASAASAARLPQPFRIETDLSMAFARLRQLPDAPRAGLMALADLGATGTTVAIGDAATGQIVSDRIRLDEANGTDLDHAVLQHILGQVADPADLTASDPNLLAALEKMRIAARAAKERLSADPVTSVAVDLPTYRGDIRVTRAELDDLAHEQIAGIVVGLRELIDRGGADDRDVAAVALCGGGAAMPIVTQRLSAEFHTAVLVDAEPYATAARGAAGVASTLTPHRTRTVVPPLADTPPQFAAVIPDPRSGSPSQTPPAGVPPAGAAATSRWQVPAKKVGSDDDRPAGTSEHGADAVTFGPRAEPQADQPPSRVRLFALLAAGAVALLVAAGGVAYALTGDNRTEAPAPGTSVTQFSTTESTPTVEETTQDTPTQQEVPDQGGNTPEETAPTEPSVTEPSVTPSGTPEPSPPPVDGGGPVVTPPPAS
ncbi:Hsp70 family protein [Gordonia sp. CPCC 205333]|uniref:Hsp70 family protein n=1 Tax=Gordonia sp. CPCC 205333 TaxID=3140790 RepID=UPI003AF37468